MRLGGRVSAAIEVLDEITSKNRPASEALKDWGKAHRFAGSADRAAIGNLVYDVLRKKASLTFRAGSGQSREVLFALLLTDWNYQFTELRDEFSEDRFAPQLISEEAAKKLISREMNEAEACVRANVPDWCEASLEANFDDEWIAESQALAERPPLDLRVNTIKATREKVLKRLAGQKPMPTRISQNGLRLESGSRGARLPNVQAEEGYRKGWFEIQDQGSQIVAELTFAQPGETVMDFCAGAGGKTLALSAMMENRGQIHAYDTDKHRLANIHERLSRAGTRNVQVHAPRSDLSALVGKMDRVLVDAPCTGSGTWRRRPDAKWRLTPENLETRVEEQEQVLLEASPFVRPGGFLVYVTCSIFPEENENQVYAFIENHPEFEMVSTGEVWEELYGADKPKPWSSDMMSVTLTPASTGTDGFYFAVMERRR